MNVFKHVLCKAKWEMYWFPVVNNKNLIYDAVYLEILLKYHGVFLVFM